MSPPSYLAVLLLAVCAKSALAANDIDETTAVIVFSVLIIIFAAIGIFFLIMIIRLKWEQKSGSISGDIRDPDWTSVVYSRNRKQRDITRMNSDHGIVAYNRPKQEPSLHTVSEKSTNTNPSIVTNHTFDHQTSVDPLLSSSTFHSNSGGAYDNPTYSSQTSQISEITVSTYAWGVGLEPLPESHDPSSSPPDYYELYKGQRPPSTSNGTLTVSFSSEEKKELSSSPETEKQPHPPAETAEHNGSIPQLISNGNTRVMHHVMHNERSVNTTSTATKDQPTDTNGTNGVSATSTTANMLAEESPKTSVKVSPSTRKRGIIKGLFIKDKPRRDSQKPLLQSQSSTTPTPTPGDSPPQLKCSSTAQLPETFYEEEHQENAQEIAPNTIYIPPMEETSL